MDLSQSQNSPKNQQRKGSISSSKMTILEKKMIEILNQGASLCVHAVVCSRLP